MMYKKQLSGEIRVKINSYSINYIRKLVKYVCTLEISTFHFRKMR